MQELHLAACLASVVPLADFAFLACDILAELFGRQVKYYCHIRNFEVYAGEFLYLCKLFFCVGHNVKAER